MIQPYNLTILRTEDYSGEHREWEETVVLPPTVVASILESAIDNMGWPEIHAFHAELRKGQDYREDAGGFFIRCIRSLFGVKPQRDEVISHAAALTALLQKAREK